MTTTLKVSLHPQPAQAQRIAVITLDGSAYGLQLLRSLEASRVPVHLVVVVANTWRRKLRLLRGVARRIGWGDALLYAAEELQASQLASGKGRYADGYSQLAKNMARVNGVRDPQLPGLLGDHAIDLVLLGQSGIIPQEVLAVPRVGTLNAHPGMLPEYRGIDCALWAILKDEFQLVGSSLHWVDAGVDTGAIIRCLEYQWRGDENVRLLGQRLYDDCVRLLVEAADTLRKSALESLPNQGGAQYYKMPRHQRRVAIRKLADFVGRQSRVQCEAERQ